MSIIVNGYAVRVVRQLSDLTGPDSDGHVGRFRFGKSGTRQIIRAVVHHRVVGSLESMTNNTFYPTTDDVLRAGERRVSSTFGIGFWGTELRIVQYVAVQNTAYTNGQTARDRDACRWQLWIDAGRPDVNGMTVSIEHEDNGSTDGGDGRYVVREEIKAASIELDRLLLSGDGPAIRAAGILCSDEAAAQLGQIVPSRQTLVDHHVPCPVSKPYCWTAIGDDKGFPQSRYIAALAAKEELMGLALRLFVTADAESLDEVGTARIVGINHALIRVRDMALVSVANGLDLGVVQRGALTSPLEAQRGRLAVAGDRMSIVAFTYDGEMHVTLSSAVAFDSLPVPSVVIPPDTTPFDQAYVDARVAEEASRPDTTPFDQAYVDARTGEATRALDAEFARLEAEFVRGQAQLQEIHRISAP